METIGERLKKWRKSKNLTMRDVADKAGISQGGLSEYENNNKLIGSKVLISLYESYNLDINWILTGNENIKQIELDEDEKELLEYFNKLSEKERYKLIGKLEGMAEQQQVKSSISETG